MRVNGSFFRIFILPFSWSLILALQSPPNDDDRNGAIEAFPVPDWMADCKESWVGFTLQLSIEGVSESRKISGSTVGRFRDMSKNYNQ